MIALTPTQVNLAYLVAAVFFIVGIRSLSSPRYARSGNLFAAVGMTIAVASTLALDQIDRYGFVALAIVVGGAIGATGARTVRMTAMPQMVALLNGFEIGRAHV